MKNSKIIENIKILELKAIEKINNAHSMKELISIKIYYLGKNGKVTNIVKLLSKISELEKPKLGKTINTAKKNIIKELEKNKQRIHTIEKEQNQINNKIDITLPGMGQNVGSLHPITQSINKIKSIFKKMSFEVHYGPEIENNYYNFESLNISQHHPARDVHDTFYLNEDHVLRTHTSGIQMRIMENNKPPIQIISPGKVYRRDSDITHTPMFHQIEGLWIDKTISFVTLKELLNMFIIKFFNKNIKTRMRPSYFPFTEPSAEIDITCVMCKSKGCQICKYTGWIEVIGCGMIHPEIIKKSKINNKEYQGLAFGLGVERLTMLYYEIDDIRLLFENNLNFLQQF